jgi:hypothetical protein
MLRGGKRWLGAIMRVTSFVLGILGGLAGVAVHAVLLFRFFGQSDRPAATLVQLALAAALGVTALLVAVTARGSTRTLAVFLPLLGVLGLFSRLLTWAPAAVLLVAGGVVALVSLRSGAGSSRPSPAFTATSPNGAALHWSQAARLGLSPSATTPPRRAESWSRARKTGVAVAAVAAAAVVISLSLWSPGSASGSGQLAGATTTTARVSAASASTTTTAPGVTTTTSTEPGIFVTYEDRESGFTVEYPSTWRSADPKDTGLRVGGPVERIWAQMFVAASFADRNGPTFDGCFLNFMWVEVYEEGTVDESMFPEFREVFEEYLEDFRYYFADVKVLEPLHSVQIGLAQGLSVTWSFSEGGLARVWQVTLLIANERAYFLTFGAVKEDWNDYRPLFEKILEDFSAGSSGPVI